MAMIGKVRRLHFRQKKSVREIARMTSLSRNTVQKWLSAPVKEEPRYQRIAGPCKLTAFHEILTLALKVDARRPKKQRRTAQKLFAEIKAAGYTGGYTRVTDFIREWRRAQGEAVSGGAFVPLAFELGEAFQFDWSEEPLVVGGIFYRAQVSHMKLCSSRAFWLVAYPSQGHEMLFDAHTRSFAALGGIARRGIYDNMKTAVDKVKKGKGRVVNARFAVMCAHYLFDADFCNVASGWEKGVVEKNVQDSRRRIWIDAAKVRFGAMPGAVGGSSTSRARSVQRGRDARARAIAPDADARALRRIRRETGTGVEHLPGSGGAQPLLGAVRVRRPDGEHATVSGPGGRRRK
jgi:transposase